MDTTDFLQRFESELRTIPDFPKPGIGFKDITTVLGNAALNREVVDNLLAQLKTLKFDAIAGIESRGFIYGNILAYKLKLPFIPIRKEGKLPHETIRQTYQLEYGEACIEVHKDGIKKGWKVLVHDDLLATGGTAEAACKLITKLGAKVVCASFLIELRDLKGRDKLSKHSAVPVKALLSI